MKRLVDILPENNIVQFSAIFYFDKVIETYDHQKSYYVESNFYNTTRLICMHHYKPIILL